MCRIDSSGMSKLSSIVAAGEPYAQVKWRDKGLEQHADHEDVATKQTSEKLERTTGGGAKEGGEGYPGVAVRLGAKEWRIVYPSRHQLLLVRQDDIQVGSPQARVQRGVRKWHASRRRMEGL
jgi:hypothetical protein